MTARQIGAVFIYRCVISERERRDIFVCVGELAGIDYIIIGNIGIAELEIVLYGDLDDYITKLVKRTREKLSEQEQEKVKRLQSKKITVYQPVTGREIPCEDANIDNYAVKHECYVFDLKANPDDMQEILSNLYFAHRLNDADVIRVGDDNSVYYNGNGKVKCRIKCNTWVKNVAIKSAKKDEKRGQVLH